jgi:hypothetical protein
MRRGPGGVKRSTWAAVLATAAVLVAAGNLPRLPLDSLVGSWRTGVERQVAAWPRFARHARAAAPAPAAASPLPQARASQRSLVPVAPAWLLATPAAPRVASRGFVPASWILPPLRVILPVSAGALAGIVAIALLAAGLRRDPRGHVWRLARRGQPLSRIARSARVPQDAVRTLLTPGIGSRR